MDIFTHMISIQANIIYLDVGEYLYAPRQVYLFGLQRENTFFDRAINDELFDGHRTFLAYPVHPLDRLIFSRRIPP
eukprot:545923-Amorphochlora_amoeboformis.AAC.1